LTDRVEHSGGISVLEVSAPRVIWVTASKRR
jgi:hypothetical protein